MVVRLLLSFGIFIGLLGLTNLEAKEKEAKNVKVSAFWEYDSVQPGFTNRLALRFKINKPWHVYWLNPGESGTPIKLKWNLPDGIVLLPQEFPAPKRLEESGITTFIYEEEVTLLFQLVTPLTETNATKTYRFSLGIDWLECSDICVPGSSELKTGFSLAKSNKLNPSTKKLFSEISKKIPSASEAWKPTVYSKGSSVILKLKSESKALPVGTKLTAFPRDGDEFGTAIKILKQSTSEVEIEFSKQASAKEKTHLLRAVVSSSLGWGENEPAESLLVETEVGTSGFLSVLLILFYAFLGGLILNLMPCVFPVISLKMMSFVRQSGGDPLQIRAQGLFYFIGVVFSFLAIAGILLVLKKGGQSLGWGFQLQTPFFVALMVYLMFAVGLNLAGLFEIGTGLTSVGGGLLTRRGNIGAILNGCLAVLIATPCTGPFMGVALGFALSQPVHLALLVFLFLGLGMGIPYLIFSFFPKLLSFLPKPGAWMVTFKQIMAFPMFATTVWLVWTFGTQRGVTGETFLIAGLVPLSIGFWILGKWDLPHLSVVSRWVSKFFALLFIGAALYLAWKGTQELPAKEVVSSNSLWQKYDPAVISELEKTHQAYFINFTASWCLTCQVNKKVALQTSRVEEDFKARGIKTFVADWTDYNAVISKALAKLNRGGIPVYVYYDGQKDSEPILLPEVLTEGIVLEALKATPLLKPEVK